MASLLAFAWRRKASDSGAATQYDNDDISPVVSASSSGDTLTNFSSQDSMFDVPRSPGTPDGFRRRKSADTIRRELNLPPKKASWERKSCVESNCGGVLPPVLSSCASMLSPQVSTSSFYTHSSQTASRVAMSPNLKIGEAKTAVGTLLAMSDRRDVSFGQAAHQQNEESILPPKFWLERSSKHEEDEAGFGINLPYDNHHAVESRYSQGSLRDDGLTTSFDNECTVQGSPSSSILQSHHTGKRTQYTEDNTMRSLMNDFPAVQKAEYTFRPLADEDMMVDRMSEPELDISEISHSLRDAESIQSLVDSHFVDDMDDLGTIEETSVSRRVKESSRDFYATSCQIRTQNVRRMQEDLLQSILERLQDVPDLLVEVKDGINLRYPNLHEDGLFSGFAKEQRDAICQGLQALDGQLHASAPGSSFAASGNTEEHLSQAVAFCLLLVKMAIPADEKPSTFQSRSSSSVPRADRRWKCVPGFRAALGFEEEPMSPEAARGGESCQFSLPSESAADSTPHTSNVSLPTTITSAFSPEKGRNQTPYQQGRCSLRRSIEIVFILFEKMSGMLLDVARAAVQGQPPSTEVVEVMNAIYLEMQNVDTDDLKALIDSFELDLVPLKISRQVSEDAADAIVDTKQSDRSTNDPIVGRSTDPLAKQLVSQTRHLPPIMVDDDVADENEERDLYLFSPATEDMNSIAQTIDDADDLRRMAGSFEARDEPEERDAPPVVETLSQRSSKKPKKSMWRRRISRKHRVAE